jgi:capsular polysaccharide biosynthesis protein
MSEQVLDLRKFVRIVRRHRKLVGIVAAFGLLLGVAYTVLSPPLLTSKTLVVFPDSAPSIATQVVVATSNPVLSGALPHITPSTSLDTLRTMVQAKSLTAYLISISAKGTTASRAEANANAVAASYVAYVTSGTGVVAVAAKIFQPATTATGTPLAEQLLIDALLGAIAGALVGSVVAIALSRSDRRLRTRDEMARSLLLPVLASLPVVHPADAAGWTKLLDDYKPGATNAWRLRSALKELGVLNGDVNNGHPGAGSSLTILSLSSDPGAFALGPQIAASAAQLGIRTALVIGPQDDVTATAPLRTACAVLPPASSRRPSLLQATVSGGEYPHRPSGAALTVVVVIVDEQASKFPDAIRTTSTVLGVSAGAATAEQLARLAVAAVSDGREIAGILVADPERTDETVGRVPRHVRGGTTTIRGGTPKRIAYPPRQQDNGKMTVNDSDQTVVFAAMKGDGPPSPTTEIRR